MFPSHPVAPFPSLPSHPIQVVRALYNYNSKLKPNTKVVFLFHSLVGLISLTIHNDFSVIIWKKCVFSDRLKFALAYWVPSAGAEATIENFFSAMEIQNSDLILITLLRDGN